MVIFKVDTGLQSRYFEGATFVACVKQAIAAQLPVQCIKAGQFFESVNLDNDSKAKELINSLR